MLLLLVMAIIGIYLFPGPRSSYEELYKNVDEATASFLQAFRKTQFLQTPDSHEEKWNCVSLGNSGYFAQVQVADHP